MLKLSSISLPQIPVQGLSQLERQYAHRLCDAYNLWREDPLLVDTLLRGILLKVSSAFDDPCSMSPSYRDWLVNYIKAVTLTLIAIGDTPLPDSAKVMLETWFCFSTDYPNILLANREYWPLLTGMLFSCSTSFRYARADKVRTEVGALRWLNSRPSLSFPYKSGWSHRDLSAYLLGPAWDALHGDLLCYDFVTNYKILIHNPPVYRWEGRSPVTTSNILLPDTLI